MYLRVVLGNAEGTGIDAVAAVETARFERGHDHAVVGYLNRICRTDQRARRFVAVHADGRHRRGSFGAINVVNEDQWIAFVGGAFATGGDAGPAANAALRIDEHCLFHRLPPFHFAG